uniref:Uncharacterized protein n=1 Tax=Arundo donax TaxID=35708 RepID=A0A0A9AS87_ARUDO
MPSQEVPSLTHCLRYEAPAEQPGETSAMPPSPSSPFSLLQQQKGTPSLQQQEDPDFQGTSQCQRAEEQTHHSRPAQHRSTRCTCAPRRGLRPRPQGQLCGGSRRLRASGGRSGARTARAWNP